MFPNRIIIASLLLALLGSGITIFNLNNEIEELNNENKVLHNKLKFNSAQIALKNNVIEEQNNNIRLLAKELSKLTTKYKKYEESYKKAKAELEIWKNKKPEIKYRYIVKKVNPDNKDLTQEDCEVGIELNKRISKLKYEDL